MAEQSYYAECRTADEAPGDGLQMAVTLSGAPEGTRFEPTLSLPCIFPHHCSTDGHHVLRAVSAAELAELMPDDEDDEAPDAMRWAPEGEASP